MSKTFCRRPTLQRVLPVEQQEISVAVKGMLLSTVTHDPAMVHADRKRTSSNVVILDMLRMGKFSC